MGPQCAELHYMSCIVDLLATCAEVSASAVPQFS